MKPKFFGAILVAGLFGIGSPATAAIVNVIYTGTIYRSDDLNGYFGSTSINALVGDEYQLKYVFNTTEGKIYVGPNFNDIAGGSALSVPSPLIRANITINGISATVRGDYDASFSSDSFGNQADQSVSTLAYADAADGYVQSYSNDYIRSSSGTLPESITGPFVYNVGPTDTASVYVQLISTGTVKQTYVDIYAHVSTLTVSPVPIPAALPMFGTAVIGLATLARRRNYRKCNDMGSNYGPIPPTVVG